MKIQRVLVTGASGKLGGPLCAALVERDYHVTGIRHRQAIDTDGVEEVSVDLADADAVAALVADADAVIHLASCKEDRQGVIDTSARGTFHLLDAAARCGSIQRFLLSSGDAVNGIYFYPNPAPIREEMPMRAYPGYYALSKVVEETMCRQFFIQESVPTVTLRLSWIHAEDDILRHLTVQGPGFGVPVWPELMTESQKAGLPAGMDATVSLIHSDGAPFRRHIVAIEDAVRAFLLSLETSDIEGEVFNIAMAEPFDYSHAAGYAARQLNVNAIELTDPVGHDFRMDVSKARGLLGYEPLIGIEELIDRAVEFRGSGQTRRRTSGYAG